MRFVIYSNYEQLYWNNEEGWGLNPTIFEANEKDKLFLPREGEWHPFTERWCPRCGTLLMFETDSVLSAEYPYYCPACDENMYEFEAKRKENENDCD
jgi:hypothetical protein